MASHPSVNTVGLFGDTGSSLGDLKQYSDIICSWFKHFDNNIVNIQKY